MKRHEFLPVAVVLLILLVSCGTTSPYGEKNPFVYSIGQEGSYVFTTTDKETIAALADIDKLKINRVTGCYDPETGLFYGAVEGSFSKGIVNTGLSVSKQVQKVRGSKITYYRQTDGDLCFYAPSNGILFFANYDIENLYLSIFKEKTAQADTVLASKILSASSGMYVKSPTMIPDLGLGLSKETAERFDSIVLLSDSEKYSVDFSLRTQDFSDSFFKLIKTAYTTALKEAGEKIDVNQLKVVILQNGLTVTLTDQDYDPSVFTGMIDQI